MQSETKQQDKNLLGTAPIGKLLFKLAVPSVIAQIVNLLYNMVTVSISAITTQQGLL